MAQKRRIQESVEPDFIDTRLKVTDRHLAAYIRVEAKRNHRKVFQQMLYMLDQFYAAQHTPKELRNDLP